MEKMGSREHENDGGHSWKIGKESGEKWKRSIMTMVVESGYSDGMGKGEVGKIWLAEFPAPVVNSRSVWPWGKKRRLTAFTFFKEN